MSIFPNKQTGIGLPASNRKWAKYKCTISPNRREIASKAKSNPLPIFDDSLYLAGVYKRVESDKMLTNLYENLCSLVVIECIDYKGEFIQTIEDYLNNITNAKSWTSSAHDKNFDYFYGRAYWVELYSINIANILAQTLYMLGDKISESTRSNVLIAIETRVLKPMDLHFSGDHDILCRHWWKNRASNWNLVCWGGVARLAISIISDQERRNKFVTEAFNGAQKVWDSWENDGFMNEGGNYFNYAVEQMIIMRQHLMEASEGKNDFFLTNPNVDKMLAFAFEYPMMGRKCAQFGDDKDGEIKEEIRNYIELTFCPNPIKNHQVMLNWSVVGQAIRYSLLMEPNNHFPVENKRTFETGLRKYYEDSAILICRPSCITNGLAASFKLLGGSSNKDGNHNHDDSGSYNIMLNGVNIAGDIGCGNYQVTWINRFEESEIWNSFSHPLPIIDGKLQTRNMNYYYYHTIEKPKVIKTSFSDDCDIIDFDLTSVYEVESLISLIRSNIYNRTPGMESVIIQDTVKFSSLTNYEFAIPSKNGTWTEYSASSTTLNGKFTVESNSINVQINANNIINHKVNTKTLNGITYTRLSVSIIDPILEETITVTYSY